MKRDSSLKKARRILRAFFYADVLNISLTHIPCHFAAPIQRHASNSFAIQRCHPEFNPAIQ
jgi:hypothetical protein